MNGHMEIMNATENKSLYSSYEITVRNHLDKCWSPFFPGWSISNMDNGYVILRIANIDQSGLHGTLNKIRDLNMILVSVQRI